MRASTTASFDLEDTEIEDFLNKIQIIPKIDFLIISLTALTMLLRYRKLFICLNSDTKPPPPTSMPLLPRKKTGRVLFSPLVDLVKLEAHTEENQTCEDKCDDAHDW